ncbi:glucosaminidase domain-containing protein [Nemorincola caseinilytica]|uniref:Glucosaminidase domain-containing protein n=1 Tax=Nemorincola caseinilytica TaxID=2054315 RepID=A0ABP8NA89_9BACT
MITLTLLLVVVTANAQNKKYITDHKILATLLGEHYGIPPSVILAVATVESAGGAGATAKVLNNHFGIVGRNRYVNHRGHKSRYKQYDNEYASYLDFCNMLTRKRFYAKLKNNKDPQAWIKAMSLSGYSESPEEWEQKINSVLHSHKL